jgi:hypothetical protein
VRRAFKTFFYDVGAHGHLRFKIGDLRIQLLPRNVAMKG